MSGINGADVEAEKHVPRRRSHDCFLSATRRNTLGRSPETMTSHLFSTTRTESRCPRKKPLCRPTHRRRRSGSSATPTASPSAYVLTIDGHPLGSPHGWPSPLWASWDGGCWRSCAASMSTPSGSWSPPCAPMRSGTAFTPSTSSGASCAPTTPTPPRPSASTTGATSTPPTASSSTATTSRPSPAPARWSARSWPPRWATCPALCGSSSACSWPAPSRTCSSCSSPCAAAAAPWARWPLTRSAGSAASWPPSSSSSCS